MASRAGARVLAACAIALAGGAARADVAVQGDRIPNVASVGAAGMSAEVASAPAVVTVRIASPATTEILRYAPPPETGAAAEAVDPGAYRTGAAASAPWAPLAPPQPPGAATPLALPATLPLVAARQLHPGDPAFLRVVDLDQNMDRTAREAILVSVVDDVTGDVEVVRLTEDGPDTGTFVGYVPTARAAAGAGTPYDGTLQVAEGSVLSSAYVDATDPGDAVSATATVAAPPSLWVRKTAGATRVGVGDFLSYEIDVTNLDPSAPAPGVTVRDALPEAFRYERGSARLNGAPAPDPVSPDGGRTFAFAVGDLAPGATASIRLAVQVGARARTGVDAVNAATASSAAGASSNVAQARVRVEDDLLATRSFVMGRVTTGACAPGPDEGPTGLAGVRVFLEDGTFAVTDRDGLFHFEALHPGLHVVQLDLASLPPGAEAVPCRTDDRHAGRGFSQLVELQGGTLWRADFHVRVPPGSATAAGPGAPAAPAAPGAAASPAPASGAAHAGQPAAGAVALTLSHAAIDRDTVEIRATVGGGGAPLEDARLAVTLPAGLAYAPGSSAVAGAAAPDPAIAGTTLSYRLGTIRPGAARTVVLRARLADGAGPGDRTVSASVSGASAAGARVETPAAASVVPLGVERVPGPLRFVTRPRFPTFGTALGPRDRAELRRLARTLSVARPKHLVVVGHTDDVPIAPRSRKRFADNVALSLARARTVAAFLGAALGMRDDQLEVLGKGDQEPVASNATARGRALNRRVEVLIHDPETIDRTVLVSWNAPAAAGPGAAPGAPAQAAATAGASGTPAAAGAAPAGSSSFPGGGATEATAAAPAAPPAPPDGFLSPSDGDLLPDRTGAVQARLASWLTPALAVDGKPVDAGRIGYRAVDARSGKTVYTWVGVDLGEKGAHALRLTGTDPFGNVRVNETISVVRTGEVASIRLVSAEGNVADGKSPVRARLELLDAAGDPIRGAARLEVRSGTLRPYRSPDDPPEPDGRAASTVPISKDGWVLFAPVTTTGSQRAVLADGAATVEIEAWVRPELRDWILVGLAEGSVGYGVAAANMEALPPDAAREELASDGRVAFYAKGQLRGSWLLTMAYDSRRGAAYRDPLFQQIDPNAYYTLYGDATEEAHDAPSTRKLYVKLEREQLYALFGDFDAGLTVTELSRYSRRMNGAKAEYHGRNAEVNAFAARTDAIHVKDEIPGDGTSGLYRLSRRPITPGSETVTLVTRDRFRSEVVLAARPLARFGDYSIDDDQGTIFFREPIPSRDDALDPITVVVEYEVAGAGEDWTAGGRAGVRLGGDRVRAGATAIHEGAGDLQRNLLGADASVAIDPHTRVRAEAAATETRDAGSSSVATAFLAEAAHASRELQARAWFREQGSGFGLGQQPLPEQGTRKFGVEAARSFGDALALTAQAWQQDTFATGVERRLGEARLRWASGKDGAYLGALEASDRLADGSRRDSGQLTAGGSLLTAHERLLLGADLAQSVWGNANADFPTRAALRAEWALTKDVALVGAEELTWGAKGRTQNTRLGLRAAPWQGAALTSSIGRALDDDASRVVGTIGLRQTLQLSEAWRIDAGAERSQSVEKQGAYRANPNVPPASGPVTGEDFTAVSAGASYRVRHLVWESRGEARLAESSRRYTLVTGAVLERSARWAFSGRAQLLGSRADASGTATSASVRLGAVYRPTSTRWILLERLDAILEQGDLAAAGTAASGLADDRSRRIVENLLANARYGPFQVSLGYGGKLVREVVAGAAHAGYTDQGSVELRHDLSERWDVGVRASALHVWSAGQVSWSAGPSVGFSPATNVWLGVGFNAAGYQDRDFSAASQTGFGPWVRMRVKLDQESVKEAASWLNRQ